MALVGSALGVVGGAVPGVTAAVALTRGDASDARSGEQPSLWRHVEVPWALLGRSRGHSQPLRLKAR